MRQLLSAGAPMLDQVGAMPYTATQQLLDSFYPFGLQSYWKSSFLKEISDAAIDTLVAYCILRPATDADLPRNHRVSIRGCREARRPGSHTILIVKGWHIERGSIFQAQLLDQAANRSMPGIGSVSGIADRCGTVSAAGIITPLRRGETEILVQYSRAVNLAANGSQPVVGTEFVDARVIVRILP